MAAEIPIELQGVAEELVAGSGFWRSCTGCHELNEGHPTGRYSEVFKCHIGLGCRECGGLGAVWDDTDYEAMAEFISRADEVTPAPHIDESKMPPRPTGSNDANTDPDSPLKRYGRASKESGLLLEPMADGYWTPWHIANEMLREAQRNAGVKGLHG